jgi:hypothetical protein
VNTVRQAYKLRGFVLGCEVFAERRECPDTLDLRDGAPAENAPPTGDRVIPATYLTRTQIWYPIRSPWAPITT